MQIWGNTTWAPDDTEAIRSAGRTYGSLITAVTSAGSQRKQASPQAQQASSTETTSDEDATDAMSGLTQSMQASVQTARTPAAAESQEEPGQASSATISATLMRFLGAGDGDGYDFTNPHFLDVSGAIRTSLAASGPLAAKKYKSWGAVHAHAFHSARNDTAKYVSKLPASLKLPMFPNALTTPLPNAPSMTIYNLYGE